MASSRPDHLRLSAIALVFLGGAIGAGLREGLSLAMFATPSHPIATLVVNTTGAFALGFLLERIAQFGRPQKTIRQFFGTGLLGGFTTYSALATDSAALVTFGLSMWAVSYALATVVIGGVATWLGIALAAGPARRASDNVGAST